MDSTNIFSKVCNICQVEFIGRITYYDHRRSCKNIVSPAGVVKTCECEKIFTCRSSYYKHVQKCEQAKNKKSGIKKTEQFLCREKNCSFSCTFRTDFVIHLKEMHNICCEVELKTFQNYAEFENWKENLEKSTKSDFFCATTRKSSLGVTKYFSCRRSGCYKSVNTGKRSAKPQGSIKIGHNCTANIKVQVCNDATVKAEVHLTHYGHDNKLARTRISKTRTSKIETSEIETSEIETSEIETSNIETSNIEISKIETLKIETFMLESSEIETSKSDDIVQESYIVSQENEDLESLRSEITSTLMALSSSVKQCNNKSLLLEARNHINTASSVLTPQGVKDHAYVMQHDVPPTKNTEEQILQPVVLKLQGVKDHTYVMQRDVPRTKNIEKQRRTVSPKKNNKPKAKYVMPTFDEKLDLKKEVLNYSRKSTNIPSPQSQPNIVVVKLS